MVRGDASIPVVALIGAATTILLGVTGFFFSSNSELNTKVATIQEINTQQTAAIAASIATTNAVQARLDHMDKQLDRIESTLTGVPVSKLKE